MSILTSSRERFSCSERPAAAPKPAHDVFSPEGVWLGAIDLPARFVADEFGENHVAGVWRDQMDVEYVRVYALQRGVKQ